MFRSVWGLSTLIILVALVGALAGCGASPPAASSPASTSLGIALPPPIQAGAMSLEEALARRRSVREFSEEPLSMPELSQLLWAAQGITGESGFRTAPSAGALYPLEVYLVTPQGVFHYTPEKQELLRLAQGDIRRALYQAALNQESVLQAPAVFVITAVYERTSAKYGTERGYRYVHLEAGHASQNLLLQAAALELGAVPVGAFDDHGIQDALGLPADRQPLYLIPVGHPQEAGP